MKEECKAYLMRLSDVYMGSIIFFLLLEIFHDKLNIKLSIVSLISQVKPKS